MVDQRRSVLPAPHDFRVQAIRHGHLAWAGARADPRPAVALLLQEPLNCVDILLKPGGTTRNVPLRPRSWRARASSRCLPRWPSASTERRQRIVGGVGRASTVESAGHSPDYRDSRRMNSPGCTAWCAVCRDVVASGWVGGGGGVGGHPGE